MHRSHIARRRGLARRVNGATEVERPIICRGNAYPYLVHPAITVACTSSLQAIATTLSDEQNPIADEILDAVRAFVSDGASPFFGRDVTVARHAAAHLRDLVLADHQAPTTGPPSRTQPRPSRHRARQGELAHQSAEPRERELRPAG